MVYNSLADNPWNLKEAIDWLVALKGTDPSTNFKAMGAALYDFLGQKPIVTRSVTTIEELKRVSYRFIGQKELKHHRSSSVMLERCNGSVEKNTGEFADAMGSKPEKVADNVANVVYACEKFLYALRRHGEHTSAYSSEATWARSCSNDPEACAKIFVGIAPMLYTRLLTLTDASKATNSVWSWFEERQRVVDVLAAGGYTKWDCRHDMSFFDLSKVLSSIKKETFIMLYNIAGVLAFY
ncbi:hypothetical protein BBBOND_0312820 [Babesia bigemina]|uniref:Uncharacterized protein n=1 Tax=Babesia bigemina TaxID=5866 RepID=A0A061DDG5_BABBI|nr:hypothetical protein BBBOND_0312820 [Babesia bigemina]CDR97379.1 hypothetical protein BBBOND_0312820 [Babesia bigemina]|eukprot:XP_012769565.1 hypothetical protein BBBOND_0312820 [Babesia bigemina]